MNSSLFVLFCFFNVLFLAYMFLLAFLFLFGFCLFVAIYLFGFVFWSFFGRCGVFFKTWVSMTKRFLC